MYLGRYKKMATSLRPMHLIVADLNAALKVVNVARAVGASEGFVYKCAEDPERSGKAMPLAMLLKLINYAANSCDGAVQGLVDELLGHLVPDDRLVVRKDSLARVAQELSAIFTGKGPAPLVREQVMLCNECGEPLQIIQGVSGKLRYECRGCRG